MIRSFNYLKLETKIILLGILITYFSTFMLTPYLTIYMNLNGYSVFQIGIVLTVTVLSQQGLTFFGGLIGNNIGYKKAIIIGSIIRILGYLLYFYAINFPLLIIASFFVGIGGALIVPSTKAAIASLEKEKKGEAFALRNTALNIGASVGPLVGAGLYSYSFNIIFIIIMFAHIVFMFLCAKYMNAHNYNEINGEKTILNDFNIVVKDYKIVYLMLVSIGFWFLYTQLTFSIPLFVRNVLNNEYLIGIMFSINALLVIALQFYLIRITESKLSKTRILFFGMLFMSLAFSMILIFPINFGMYLFILLFTISEILVAPTIDNVASDLAPSNSLLGGYLGFVSLGWAIGGTLGNFLGGLIYSLLSDNDSIIYLWLFYALVALLTALLFRNKYLLNKSEKINQDPYLSTNKQ